MNNNVANDVYKNYNQQRIYFVFAYMLGLSSLLRSTVSTQTTSTMIFCPGKKQRRLVDVNGIGSLWILENDTHRGTATSETCVSP